MSAGAGPFPALCAPRAGRRAGDCDARTGRRGRHEPPMRAYKLLTRTSVVGLGLAGGRAGGSSRGPAPRPAGPGEGRKWRARTEAGSGPKQSRRKTNDGGAARATTDESGGETRVPRLSVTMRDPCSLFRPGGSVPHTATVVRSDRLFVFGALR